MLLVSQLIAKTFRVTTFGGLTILLLVKIVGNLDPLDRDGLGLVFLQHGSGPFSHPRPITAIKWT